MGVVLHRRRYEEYWDDSGCCRLLCSAVGEELPLSSPNIAEKKRVRNVSFIVGHPPSCCCRCCRHSRRSWSPPEGERARMTGTEVREFNVILLLP
nr:hypothetical protein Itr_chr15CG12230 [Ipomoea trifida]GMD97843.1 hypothetical protein Iba_chr15cCG6450 [Ipomoea batatas]GME06419.1 hypothetical protein Iba_scaffold4046CG0100 [Ipomoea batatas]GME06589.1 hypothetical protein Iba_scaffold4562CG0010 [Ipomoea batatas]